MLFYCYKKSLYGKKSDVKIWKQRNIVQYLMDYLKCESFEY